MVVRVLAEAAELGRGPLMKQIPTLEYRRRASRWPRIYSGILGLTVGVFANLVPYVLTYHAYDGDGFERVGFPITFFSQGGFAYRRYFSWWAVVGDLLFVAGMFGLGIGVHHALKLKSKSTSGE
jgi:hypothetical protein